MTHQKSYRKFVAASASAVIVASAVAPAVSAASFTDVTDRYKEAVDFVVSKGAKGLTESSFGVSKEIKRVDAAVLLANVLGLDMEKAPESGFIDVPARAKGAVNALKEAGITSGKTETTFDSNSYITRGELAIWLQKGFELKGSSEKSFSDVTKFYEAAVKALVANEITDGISSKEFGVNQKAKRGDFAIFLYRASQVKSAGFKLTVMHTNDTHANLDNVARRITAIKQVREENPDALLLQAGDVFAGTLYFNEFNGLADAEFMNLAGYDAMAFGNHEFDKGTAMLADFVKASKFPFLSANIDFSKDANLKASFTDGLSANPEDGQIYSGIIKEVDGEKIGIFGLTTEETKDIASPGPDVVFENYIEEAEKAVAAFQAQGVNKIIAVNHIGYDDGGGDNDITLAKEVEGIDVIVGGHSHTKLEEPVVDNTGEEPTIIVQANEYSKYLGTLDVTFDENGKVIGQAGKLIEIDKKENDVYVLKDDPEAAQILATKYKPTVIEKQNTVVGKTTVELLGGNPPARTVETNLGNLITDGMLAKAKTINPQTVIAIQNGGGIRKTVPAGDISLANVLEVMPFGNTLGIMKLTGAEIKSALEFSVKDAPKPFGGFLQVSGLKFTYDSSKPAGEKVQTVQVKEDGVNYVAIDPAKTYVVATNTFTAKGGDGYTMFAKAYSEGRVSEPGYVDWEIFTDYINTKPEKTVSPTVEGRIVDVAK